MGRNIVIIDDDKDILETTGALLAHRGYDIHSAVTIEEGIGMIDELLPDLILLDVMFPEKQTRGFEASEEIKRKHPEIPIFIFTAINREYAFDLDIDDVSADEFLNKPVKIDRMVELIHKYLDE